MDSNNIPDDTNSFEFSFIAHNSAAAPLKAGHSCFLENTLMQQPWNIKTPPDTLHSKTRLRNPQRFAVLRLAILPEKA